MSLYFLIPAFLFIVEESDWVSLMFLTWVKPSSCHKKYSQANSYSTIVVSPPTHVVSAQLRSCVI